VTIKLSYGENAGGVALIKKEGRSLAREATLQDEFGLFEPVPPGATVTYEVEMRQGRNDILRETVSNTVKGNTC
jgi:hypothetical protein